MPVIPDITTDYPALPYLGQCDIDGIEDDYIDPTIASPMENGLVVTRPRYSRVRRTRNVPYRLAPQVFRDVLDDFIRFSVLGSSGIFYWTDPRTDEQLKVRFKQNSLPKPVESGRASGVLVWNFNLELEEV
jgi:hypothetical protein